MRALRRGLLLVQLLGAGLSMSFLVSVCAPVLLCFDHAVWSAPVWSVASDAATRSVRVSAAESWLYVDALAPRRTTAFPGFELDSLLVDRLEMISQDLDYVTGLSPCDGWRTISMTDTDGPQLADARRLSVKHRTHVAVIQWGWPMAQLAHIRWENADGSAATSGWVQLCGTDERRHASDPATLALPLMIGWYGTVFNAALWTGCIVVGRRVAHHICSNVRRRTGRCGRCGYCVRGLMYCPECGHSVDTGLSPGTR